MYAEHKLVHLILFYFLLGMYELSTISTLFLLFVPAWPGPAFVEFLKSLASLALPAWLPSARMWPVHGNHGRLGA
jgi:hypothetical protein